MVLIRSFHLALIILTDLSNTFVKFDCNYRVHSVLYHHFCLSFCCFTFFFAALIILYLRLRSSGGDNEAFNVIIKVSDVGGLLLIFIVFIPYSYGMTHFSLWNATKKLNHIKNLLKYPRWKDTENQYTLFANEFETLKK